MPVDPCGAYNQLGDSMDAMEGPFALPADIREGDYIEFGMLGAYGVAMQTRFNGFGETEDVAVQDQPWTSMYSVVDKRAPAPRDFSVSDLFHDGQQSLTASAATTR